MKIVKLMINGNLAEIVGVMLGDGCIYKEKEGVRKTPRYQSSVSLHKEEMEYALYLKNLLSQYFKGYTFSIWECKKELSLANTSVFVGSLLKEAGLHHGNKVKNKVTIPGWILKNRKYTIRTIRGLFDTDGCVYRKYDNYAQIQFKFGCLETTSSIHDAIKLLKYNPTKIQKEWNDDKKRWRWKFYLSRQGEICTFFREIKPKNPKHQLRYKKIKNGDAGIRTQISRFLPRSDRPTI